MTRIRYPGCDPGYTSTLARNVFTEYLEQDPTCKSLLAACALRRGLGYAQWLITNDIQVYEIEVGYDRQRRGKSNRGA
jgi:hypothetical protein